MSSDWLRAASILRRDSRCRYDVALSNRDSEVHSFINIAGLSPAAGLRAPSRLLVGMFVTIQESRVAWEFSRTM